ncbi:MAG: PH domain-containing protein [Cyclobacteriaceae bacterium]|jgi:hypothetical protein|nr:PH domain-containing protein [Cyclobacteriaceae bacterium]
MNRKVYSAKRGGFFLLAVLLPLAFAVWVTYRYAAGLGTLIPLLPLVPTVLFTWWLFFATRYWIEGSFFHYQCGWMVGRIDIRTIQKLEVGRTLWVGTKPALGSRGIVIHVGKVEEIYVAPEDNEVLVRDLLAVNPGIDVYGMAVSRINSTR